MKRHGAAGFLIRKRIRELKQAVATTRDDRQYTPNIEENYVQPLLREIDELTDTYIVLGQLQADEPIRS